MKILITGKNSYIGTSFETWLKQYGDKYQVQSIDVKGEDWKKHDFSQYDVVLHVAGIAHRKENKKNKDLYYKVNRDLAVEVAKKAKNERVKHFIYMSSMSVYGLEKGVITKNTIPFPISNYGKSKLDAEKIITALADIDFLVSIVRPPMVYGEGCKGNYAKLAKLVKITPVFPKIQNERSMINIVELCKKIEKIMYCSTSGIHFPQDEKYLSTSFIIEEISRIYGKKIWFTEIFNPLLKILPKSIKNKVFDSLIYSIDDFITLQIEGGESKEFNYSVLMSVYKYENPNNLNDSIQSIINQTIKPNEIVLVEDGPLTNELYEVIENLENSGILKVVKLERNIGLGNALNIGMTHCNNEYIARMDSDDISYPYRCEKQLKFLECNPNVSVVGSSVEEFINTPTNIVAYKDVVESDLEIRSLMKYRNAINHPTVMFKKSDVLCAGGYKDLLYNEDYFLWIRMIERNFIFSNINQPLIKMRVSDETYERRGGWSYFINQRKLFLYMLKMGYINRIEFIFNNLVRFIVRVILPNKARRHVYIKFLRKKSEKIQNY